MVNKSSERRLVENQVIFRRLNSRVQRGFDEVNAIAAQDGECPIGINDSLILHFYCECSDEHCKKRIKLSLNVYNAVHSHNDEFTIVCGHEALAVEDVVNREQEYCVVKKHNEPPKNATSLNSTNISNV